MNDKQPNIDPWGSELVGEKDYQRIIEEFGIELVEDLDIPASFFEDNLFFRRKLIIGHRGFETILKAIRLQKPWAIMSGIKPSGKFHLGTLMTAKEMVELQNQGGFVYYSIADIESYVDHGMTYETALEIAQDNIADIIALGLDVNRAYIWLQSKEKLVKEMVFEAGRYVTLAMMKAIYGERRFGLYNCALVQVGDILLPQLKEEVMPTVVPVGLDQDPHLRLVRDLSKYFKKNGVDLIKPASTYHKLLPSLTDITKKMSKSISGSSFYFDQPEEEISKIILRTYTGGRRNKKEQQELGGEPDKCMIYQILKIYFEPDDAKLGEVFQKCINGELMCGDHKRECAEKVLDFVKNHIKKKERAIDIARQLLNTD